MKNRFPLLVLFFWFAALSFGIVAPTALAAASPLWLYENRRVERVAIEVMEQPAVTHRTFIDAARLKIRLTEGNEFSQVSFDADLKELASYFSRVEPEIIPTHTGLQVIIRIWVKPTIRSLCWRGNQNIPASDLQRELGISSLGTFEKASFNNALRNVKRYYVKKGYYQADLSYTVEECPDSRDVNITITVEEGYYGKIRHIHFVGFTHCEEEALRSQLYTKPYSIWTSWLTDTGTFHEELLQQDELTALTYLQNLGYADAIVHSDVVPGNSKDKAIDLYIIAEKGPLYHISEVTITGNTLFSEEQIACQLALQPGEVYSPERLRLAAQRVTALYGKCGYIDAYVDYEPRLNHPSQSYAIAFRIDEGEQWHVGMIKVFGNCSTETKAILHETLLVPGELFNVEKMRKTQERLQNVGFFSDVNVYAVHRAEGQEGNLRYRDVHIEVQEANTGHLGAFLGFSTLDQFFGGVNYSENNFKLSGLRHLGTKGYSAIRGGGEYLHTTFTLGQKSRRYQISWTRPYLCDTPWALSLDIDKNNNRYTSKDYDIDSIGFSARLTRPLDLFWKFSWHYRLRDSHVTLTEEFKDEVGYGDDPLTPAEHQRRRGYHHSLLEEARNSGVVSAAGFSFIYDSTNHPRRPTSGFKSTIDVEVAGLGGRHDFISLSYLNSYYIQLSLKEVLKLRADCRFLFPFGSSTAHSLPLDERLFIGGDSVVRGYRAWRLGPLFPDTDDPRGGVSLQTGSMEYSRKLTDTLFLFGFFDAGALTDRSGHFGKVYMSCGGGLKWHVFGDAPLVVGVGFPLNADTRGQVKRFFFAIEGMF